MQNTRYEMQPPAMGGLGRFLEGPAAWLITFVALPALVIVALLLPPVRLLDRLQAFTYTRISAAGGAVQDADGTLVSFPAEAVRSRFMISLESTPRPEFIEGQAGRELYEAASNIPDFLIPKSPYYDIEILGTEPDGVVLSIPIPNDSLPYETLGLYTWTGAEWIHLPSLVLADQEIIEANLSYMPASFMVMQTAPAVPAVTLDLGLDGSVPENAYVASEAKAGLYLRGDGALEGTAPVNSGNTMPVIRNWDGEVVRTDLINNLLIDPGLQENQLMAVEQTVDKNGYIGVVLDYRGIDAVPSARADYVHLVSKLASRLHASNKTIAVRVEAPSQISADTWDTLGFDWSGLGAVVDRLIVPAPVDPMAYAPGGEMDALLRFATSQVERRKLQIELPAQSVERAGNYLLPKGYAEALQPLLAQVISEGGDQEIALSLDNPRLLSQVIWDEVIGMYYYTYVDDQGFERTVYIETAGSVGHKLTSLSKYNVRNVSIQTSTSSDIDPNIWEVLLQFQQGGDLSGVLNQLHVAYTLYDQGGNVVAQEVRPINNPRVVMAAPASGELRVQTEILNASGRPLAAAPAAVLSVGAAQAAPEVNETETAATEAEPVTLSSGQVVNVRQGPGTAYPVLGQVAPGVIYPITGKNETGDWWQIDVSGAAGWVIGQLVSINGDTNALAVVTDLPDVPAMAAAAPAAAEAPAAEAPAAAPVAVAAPPPSGGGSFGYGIQAHMVHNDQAGQVMAMIQGMGFNWVKQQVEWKVFEGSEGAIDFGSLDGIINAANASGINVLFSVVNAPGWAREPGFDGSVGGPPADPQKFANFLGALAGKYCGGPLKAIEVWNEQNLHYEWGNKPLNPGEYVALLAPSYAAIKGACPSMYVISGALTPAGNNPPYAMDDFTYLEQMFQAGLNNYIDGVGAHPSGYNVPPSVTWEGACEAIQIHGNSFNGACDSPHHSWSFRSTMEGYRNIMNVYGAGDKKIWPTEFGWAAGGAFHSAYQYANDNSYEEQAQWTVEAYQMMKNWGWVGPAFLWNLNFRVVADGTEKAQWGIVDNSWNPLPAYNALAAMPK
jgi:SH3-like domain-containing protein